MNKKIKLTLKHFQIFKAECEKWIDKLKLDNWEIHFRWQDTDGVRASCNSDLSGYIATLFLSKEWDNYERNLEQEIKLCAKHEVLHLLLARLSINAKTRYILEGDLEEAEEELVRKLEKIIKE